MSESTLNETLKTLSKTIRDNTLSTTIDQTVEDAAQERAAITEAQQRIARKNLGIEKLLIPNISETQTTGYNPETGEITFTEDQIKIMEDRTISQILIDFVDTTWPDLYFTRGNYFEKQTGEDPSDGGSWLSLLTRDNSGLDAILIKYNLTTHKAVLQDNYLQPKLTAGKNINLSTITGVISTDTSKVTASASGTSSIEVSYLTIDDVEYKVVGGGEGPSYQAGNGITITGNTISALYSAGSGINIDEDYEISTNYDNIDIGSGLTVSESTIMVDYTSVQGTLSAGENINISSNNTISASIPVATTVSAGLMSAADKTKLDGINQYIKHADVSEGTLVFTDNQNNLGTKIGKGLKLFDNSLEIDDSMVPMADLPRASGLYGLRVTLIGLTPVYTWELIPDKFN